MELLKIALLIAALLHFSLLFAGLSMPRVLGWQQDLKKVDPFTRQIILVHGAFIVLIIAAFGMITLAGASELVQGGILAAALAGFIGLFWLGRLLIQLFYFDAERWLTTALRRLGYRAMTLVFAYLAAAYLTTAWINVQRIWPY